MVGESATIAVAIDITTCIKVVGSNNIVWNRYRMAQFIFNGDGVGAHRELGELASIGLRSRRKHILKIEVLAVGQPRGHIIDIRAVGNRHLEYLSRNFIGNPNGIDERIAITQYI